jgi:hypothetical protein
MAMATSDLEWFCRWTAEYHSSKDDAMGVVEDLDELGKLGQGFSSMDDLEKSRYRWWSHSSAYICKCTSKHEPKTGNNQVVEVLHVLFCLGFHWDAKVK